MCPALLLVLDWKKISPSCYCKSQQEQLTSSSINCSKDVTRQIWLHSILFYLDFLPLHTAHPKAFMHMKRGSQWVHGQGFYVWALMLHVRNKTEIEKEVGCLPSGHFDNIIQWWPIFPCNHKSPKCTVVGFPTTSWNYRTTL